MADAPWRPTWPAAALGASVAVGISAAMRGFVPLDPGAPSTADIGTLFLTLVFAALVIERAVEVYVGNVFDPQEARLMRPQRQKAQELALVSEAISNETQRARGLSSEQTTTMRTEETLAKLRAEADRVRGELAEIKRGPLDDVIEFKARKASVASAVATALGAAAAATGLRVLEPLATDEALALITGVEGQLFWFRLVDVVLTALLLAGGADGIHQILGNLLARRDEIAGAGRA